MFLKKGELDFYLNWNNFFRLSLFYLFAIEMLQFNVCSLKTYPWEDWESEDFTGSSLRFSRIPIGCKTYLFNIIQNIFILFWMYPNYKYRIMLLETFVIEHLSIELILTITIKNYLLLLLVLQFKEELLIIFSNFIGVPTGTN